MSLLVLLPLLVLHGIVEVLQPRPRRGIQHAPLTLRYPLRAAQGPLEKVLAVVDDVLALLGHHLSQQLEEILHPLAVHLRLHVDGGHLRQGHLRLPEEPVHHVGVVLAEAMDSVLRDVVKELLVPELHLVEPPKHDDEALHAEGLGVDQAARGGERRGAELRLDVGHGNLCVEEGDRPEHEVLHAVPPVGLGPTEGEEEVLQDPRRQAVLPLAHLRPALHFLCDGLEDAGVASPRRG
mmetsp:Transcript_70069/g.216689  ORF Transcript_70069/g.216689 Transcript_70069/m.216689 type:complete len:237 (+) Transcript_70069:452-1162(+)